jgi:hypothetical protein
MEEKKENRRGSRVNLKEHRTVAESKAQEGEYFKMFFDILLIELKAANAEKTLYKKIEEDLRQFNI